MFKRVTKRIIRSLFLTVVIVTLIIIYGGPVLVKRLVGVDALVSWVSGELSEKLHRQLIIRDVSVSFFDGMRLSDVQISERPTFKEGTFIKADRFVLRPSFFDLIFGKVNVTEVSLEGATVNLVRDSSGTWNLTDLFVSSETTPKSLAISGTAEEERGEPFALDVEDVKISGGRFLLKDARKKIPEFEAKDIYIRVSDFSLNSAFKASVGFTINPDPGTLPVLQAWLKPPLKFDYKGMAHLAGGRWRDMSFVMDHLSLQSDHWVMETTGNIKSLEPLSGRIKSRFRFNQYVVKFTSDTISFDGPADLGIRLRSPVYEAEGAPSVPDEVLFPQFSKSAFDLELSGDRLKWSWDRKIGKAAGVPLKLKATGDMGSIPADPQNRKPRYKEMRGTLTLKTSTAEEFASIKDWTLRISSASIPGRRKEAGSLVEITMSSGSFPSQTIFSIVEPIKDWNARGGFVKWSSATLTSIAGHWKLDAESVQVKQNGLNRGKEKIGSLEAAFEHASWGGHGKLFHMDYNGTFSMHETDVQFLSCRDLVGITTIRGLGNRPNHKVNGEIHARLDNGLLKNIPEMVKVFPFMGFLVKPLTILQDLHYWGILKIKNPDFTVIAMDFLQADYFFYDNKMSMDKVTMKGPIGTLEVLGAVDFPNSAINVTATVNVPKGQTPFVMADSFSDSKGNPHFSIKIKGTLDKPQIYTIPANKKDMLTTDLDDQFKLLKKKAKAVWRKIFH